MSRARAGARRRESWQMYGRLAELAPGAGGGVPEEAQRIPEDEKIATYLPSSPPVVAKGEDTPC